METLEVKLSPLGCFISFLLSFPIFTVLYYLLFRERIAPNFLTAIIYKLNMLIEKVLLTCFVFIYFCPLFMFLRRPNSPSLDNILLVSFTNPDIFKLEISVNFY